MTRPSWQNIRHLIFFSLSKRLVRSSTGSPASTRRCVPRARRRILPRALPYVFLPQEFSSHGTRRYWRYCGAAAVSDTRTPRWKRRRESSANRDADNDADTSFRPRGLHLDNLVDFSLDNRENRLENPSSRWSLIVWYIFNAIQHRHRDSAPFAISIGLKHINIVYCQGSRYWKFCTHSNEGFFHSKNSRNFPFSILVCTWNINALYHASSKTLAFINLFGAINVYNTTSSIFFDVFSNISVYFTTLLYFSGGKVL